MGLNGYELAALRSHQQVHLSFSAVSSRDLSKVENNETNGCNILRSLLYAEDEKLKNDYANVTLISSNTYNINMTAETEPTVMLLLVSSVNVEAAPNLIKLLL